MSERGDFEANEIRGMAERYGGRREPGKLGYVFPALCWCCPMWQHVELVLRPGADPTARDALMCPNGCRRSTEEGALSKPCPSEKPGHAGYRHLPASSDD